MEPLAKQFLTLMSWSSYFISN